MKFISSRPAHGDRVWIVWRPPLKHCREYTETNNLGTQKGMENQPTMNEIICPIKSWGNLTSILYDYPKLSDMANHILDTHDTLKPLGR